MINLTHTVNSRCKDLSQPDNWVGASPLHQGSRHAAGQLWWAPIDSDQRMDKPTTEELGDCDKAEEEEWKKDRVQR